MVKIMQSVSLNFNLASLFLKMSSFATSATPGVLLGHSSITYSVCMYFFFYSFFRPLANPSCSAVWERLHTNEVSPCTSLCSCTISDLYSSHFSCRVCWRDRITKRLVSNLMCPRNYTSQNTKNIRFHPRGFSHAKNRSGQLELNSNVSYVSACVPVTCLNVTTHFRYL